MSLREDAAQIIREALHAAKPNVAVEEALSGVRFPPGRLLLVSIGKGAWQMAKTASDILGERIDAGVVITKTGHVGGELPRVTCYEAGHPIPDQRSYMATQAAIDLVKNLGAEDGVLFLISGGGSALFEQSMLSPPELEDLTRQLLACGADIVEINLIRKRLSHVKGGRFAKLCAPARVYSMILSDVLGDRLDMIASGPAYPDQTTYQQALEVIKKYDLKVSEAALALLRQEPPKELDNVESYIIGSVRQLCESARSTCLRLGYEPIVMTDKLSCEARAAGRWLAEKAKDCLARKVPIALIAGGETVVTLTGQGLGGRNQELALSAAAVIEGLDGIAIFSVGSDGTDGPTDAAGGYTDGDTARLLRQKGTHIEEALRDNDSYHALEQCGGLIITGPTGTNVNDLSAALIRGV